MSASFNQWISLLPSALHDVTPPPCDAPCRHRKRCAAEKMACGLFAHYVGRKQLSPKPDKNPTQDLYNAIYSGKDEESSSIHDLERLERARKKSNRAPEMNIVRYVYAERKKGRTFPSIGEEIGVNPSTLRDWVKKVSSGWWASVRKEFDGELL